MGLFINEWSWSGVWGRLRASPRSESQSLGTGGIAEKSDEGKKGQEQGALKASLTSEAMVHF